MTMSPTFMSHRWDSPQFTIYYSLPYKQTAVFLLVSSCSFRRKDKDQHQDLWHVWEMLLAKLFYDLDFYFLPFQCMCMCVCLCCTCCCMSSYPHIYSPAASFRRKSCWWLRCLSSGLEFVLNRFSTLLLRDAEYASCFYVWMCVCMCVFVSEMFRFSGAYKLTI